MAILLTGGGGFIGINVLEQLVGEGEHVVVFDCHGLPAIAAEELRCDGGAVDVVAGDVRDAALLAAVFRDFGVQHVVHAAVITSDTLREAREPKEIVEVNVSGTLTVLSAAHAAKCERFVYMGSGQAYGKAHDEGLPLREETSPSRPQDVYGITKFAAEQIALRLGELWQLQVVCVRLGSVCGPWEFDTGVRDMLSPHLRAAQLALRGETAVIPPKEVWRDWIYSRDVAAGIVAALRAKAPRHRLYHVASGMDWQRSFPRWCEELQREYPRFCWRVAQAGERPNVSFLLERDRAPMDITRAVDDLGFKPRFGPDAAYRDYVKWIRDHEDFLAVKESHASPREMNWRVQ